MEFYLIQNQPNLLHRIIEKTHSSVIAALPSVKFNIVITGIEIVNCSPNHCF